MADRDDARARVFSGSQVGHLHKRQVRGVLCKLPSLVRAFVGLRRQPDPMVIGEQQGSLYESVPLEKSRDPPWHWTAYDFLQSHPIALLPSLDELATPFADIHRVRDELPVVIRFLVD
ncbi:MAG: hypothetical protein QM757_20655 [Paludibaculum sp.]